MVTFVTAYMLLNESRPNEKTADIYFSQFKRLVESGVNIHLFLQSSMLDLYNDIIGENPNVFLEIQEFEELEIYKELRTVEYTLPSQRNLTKDSANFMILMNSKIEFVKKAMTNNVYNSDTFAWIDFGIGHVIKNNETFNNLKTLSIKKGLYIPGPYSFNNVDFNSVCWRFCGGFFIGDKDSLEEFHSLYQKEFLNLVKSTGILSWEVNVWAFFERFLGWKPNWYYGDHNDSILNLDVLNQS
jgi:hypothetical protein